MTGCTACHSGTNFAGPPLPVGEGFYQKIPLIPGSGLEKKYDLTSDLDRGKETKNPADNNMWRVPTWRNVARTVIRQGARPLPGGSVASRRAVAPRSVTRPA